MLIAASIDAAFKSGILSSAIFCTSALLIVATLVLLGTAEPDLILQAFFNKTGAGGVFGNEAEASVTVNSNYYRNN